jgi:hypothetical protein
VQSEDSDHLNTSFVERLNLTIRQGSAYLRRCSPCHARGEDQLRGHVELLRCHYNFVRPHRALQFGRETRTRVMQAGVVSTRLSWNDIFTAPDRCRYLPVAVVRFPVTVQFRESATTALSTFSWPHKQRLAAWSTANDASTDAVMSRGGDRQDRDAHTSERSRACLQAMPVRARAPSPSAPSNPLRVVALSRSR